MLTTKPSHHFNHQQLDADKYNLNYAAHLKHIDISSLDVSSANELEYVRNLKENNKYFVESTTNYAQVPPTPTQSVHRGEQYSSSGIPNHNGLGAEDKTDESQQRLQHGYTDDNVIEFEDSMSNNGDSGKESSGTGKRKRFDDMDAAAEMQLKYKGVDMGKVANSFEYMKSFDGIRARNFEDIQNEEQQQQHHRMMNGTVSGGGAGSGVGSDYREEHGNRVIDESNVNYASSDDLNLTTNSSDHGEKAMSGSDDESTSKYKIRLTG